MPAALGAADLGRIDRAFLSVGVGPGVDLAVIPPGPPEVALFPTPGPAIFGETGVELPLAKHLIAMPTFAVRYLPVEVEYACDWCFGGAQYELHFLTGMAFGYLTRSLLIYTGTYLGVAASRTRIDTSGAPYYLDGVFPVGSLRVGVDYVLVDRLGLGVALLATGPYYYGLRLDAVIYARWQGPKWRR